MGAKTQLKHTKITNHHLKNMTQYCTWSRRL